MANADFKDKLLDVCKSELLLHGVVATPETLYEMLCGVQDSWYEDDTESAEKTEWMIALRSLIHDQLHAMETA